jgi:hypothetical protein
VRRLVGGEAKVLEQEDLPLNGGGLRDLDIVSVLDSYLSVLLLLKSKGKYC